jgi:hypothetical protein
MAVIAAVIPRADRLEGEDLASGNITGCGMARPGGGIACGLRMEWMKGPAGETAARAGAGCDVASPRSAHPGKGKRSTPPIIDGSG